MRGLHLTYSMINTPVVRRFNIEDIIFQDSSGVTFRAFDTVTGETVALRRFFPFGPDGGGLHGEEQTAYNIAVERLAGLRHPALRAIVCGGCDPIDGMPYIATELIEGETLEHLMENGPLPAEAASSMVTRLLDVCSLISNVLAEEAVWVDMEPHTIIRGDEKSGRGFTFWISPQKWLGDRETSRGLQAVLNLTEEITGWKNKPVSDQAGRGFGGWVKWLRKNPSSKLLEARESLATSTGANPSSATKSPTGQISGVPATATKTANAASPGKTATQTAAANTARSTNKSASAAPSAPVAPARSKGIWLIVMAVTFALLVGVGYYIYSKKKSHDLAASADSPVSANSAVPAGDEEEDIAQIQQRAAEVRAQAAAGDQVKQAQLAIQKSEYTSHGGVFHVNEREQLLRQEGYDVTVEGVLQKLDYSMSRKTIYLQFYKEPGRRDTCASVLLKDAPADLSEERLTPLIGRKLRIKGIVQVHFARPEIKIKDRSSIKIIE